MNADMNNCKQNKAVSHHKSQEARCLCSGSSLLWCSLLRGWLLGRSSLLSFGSGLGGSLGDATGLGLVQGGWLVDDSWGLQQNN